ncbi:MAG: DUF924 family protein [Alphaproteobacteria bacterium]
MAEGPNDVLDFWFVDHGADDWFGKNPRFDALIADRFGRLVARACDGGLAGWNASPDEVLAQTLVLDQFPRNMYRGSPHTYAGDPHALPLARRVAAEGVGAGWPLERLLFLWLPLMHSEELADQDRCVALLAPFAGEEMGKRAHDSALRHREIVERFGRFPHRNAVLGRASSAEEVAFLTEPNSSF